MKKKVVTRFAPSPTGYIHIGNVRSAIYPYLVARQAGGKFILRIEDTDRARYVEGATELIVETLKWLGLDWDEGPGVGGDNGPYFQTERTDIYYEWGKKLIASGRAYADTTPAEKIGEYREKAKAEGYPFLYRNYRPAETPEWEVGMPLRFKAEPKNYEYHDEVMGDLKMGEETQDDFILIKADGLPTYNFAHIIDDVTMDVTHVIRGQEYLPSMGNYLALYDALQIERPIFVHLPHILGPSGTKKLSKRDGAKSVTNYRDEGILPEAMLNFLACLGWNDGTEQEIFTKEDLIEKFRLDRIQRASARFDEQKLVWLNGQWIRKLFVENPEELHRRAHEFWDEYAKDTTDERKNIIMSIIYDRLKTLADLRGMTRYFFVDPEVDLDMLLQNKFLKKMSEEELQNLLQAAVKKLETVEDWTPENIRTALNELLIETKTKPPVLFSPIRIALSFAPFSPALPETMEVLSKEVVLARLNAVIRALSNER
ncbi:glutamate--tRNA ligase [Candidatus Saccharibacteria bacterium]|nr:glutamate--tRNA ligase [Candidatus Saccharibacteria bacterium]